MIFRFSRLAVLARCSDGPWWSLDEWHPRCDPRIPHAEHELQAHYGCSPSRITQPWLREAVKWCLGTQLEAGTLRWSTVSQERMRCFARFDRWLETFTDPLDVLGGPAHAFQLAAAFRRWDTDPANRLLRQNEQRFAGQPVHPRLVNDDLRAVAELFAFVAANPIEARQVLGPNPWSRVTDAHADGGSLPSPPRGSSFPPDLDHQGQSQMKITKWVTFDTPSEGPRSAVADNELGARGEPGLDVRDRRCRVCTSAPWNPRMGFLAPRGRSTATPWIVTA
ncbi:hypothetical protein ACIQWN_38550 [Streptomyces vinaceus]|uniref:hypothetical protein n=1 Tax=Streptomyces vinaceus TaxID=1960 RepID=UPI003815AF07